ncbi:MAG: DUF4923 family protein [Prevotella sp.]|nr:DUF4923 family protein [Prevotella sp.]
MKKILIKGSILLALLLLGSNANAQVISNILKKVTSSKTSTTESTDTENADTDSSSSSSGSSGIISSLTSIFSSLNAATEDKIIGTWVYKEPAVVLSSENTLKNIGGKIASATVEDELASQYEKLGIKEGTITMTFDEDGNFTQTISGKNLSGTYTVEDENINLKYGKLKQIVGTTQLDGNNLIIVMDATKLLSLVNLLGSLSGNSLLEGATSLLSSMDGLQVGFKLTKQ